MNKPVPVVSAVVLEIQHERDRQAEVDLMSETQRIPLADFQLAAEAAGYRFQCPMCGNIATADDFKNAGADPERAAQECIGRTMKPMPKPSNGKTPCDWAAFGLFRALGKGLIVVMPDGKEIPTFAIAPRAS